MNVDVEKKAVYKLGETALLEIVEMLRTALVNGNDISQSLRDMKLEYDVDTQKLQLLDFKQKNMRALEH